MNLTLNDAKNVDDEMASSVLFFCSAFVHFYFCSSRLALQAKREESA